MAYVEFSFLFNMEVQTTNRYGFNKREIMKLFPQKWLCEPTDI